MQPIDSSRPIDVVARETVKHRFGLPDCLHIPVAARDAEAMESYIGTIEDKLGYGNPCNAYLVTAFPAPLIDPSLPNWKNPASEVFHLRRQVWVHVNYTRYRAAYKKAFPKENIDGMVLSHALNRRVAAIKGFGYVRITPTSRSANSSSAYTEQWSIVHNSQPNGKTKSIKSGVRIQYADLPDLLLMMDFKLGGGVQDVVNRGQNLIRPA